MHLSTFLATSLAVLASALPHQKRLVEDTPWHLTNLTVFDANAGFTNSTISFSFTDTNKGLAFNTYCSRSVAGSINDPGSYYPCANATTSFRWDGQTLDLQRTYIDPSVSPAPFWFVTAFGHAQPNLTTYYLAEEGKGQRQAALDVPITEMVSK